MSHQPASSAFPALVTIAEGFSPRYEQHRDDLVSIDIRGLERLLGPPNRIAEELRREAAAGGGRVHIAIAGTRATALVLAVARPGLTVVEPGGEAAMLEPVRLEVLATIAPSLLHALGPAKRAGKDGKASAFDVTPALKRWGLRTLGELAALPSPDLAARLGPQALVWQAIARGEEARPLVPMLPEERFESSLELEWPIEGLEPLSFVLTRLLEPLATRLERRDRAAAGIHVTLRLVSKAVHARRLHLPFPIRDVRALRTLALLDLESHPPPAAIDGVALVIEPTPARALQHTLFARAHPTPEQLATLVARLGALMGQDRLGRARTVDSYRPGAFAMEPFAARLRSAEVSPSSGEARRSAEGATAAALRRCRQPVPARVAGQEGRPVRLTTDRRGFAGGAVISCAGPWRSSGHWWAGACPPDLSPWNREEWDVLLGDGAVYRIFRDCETDAWFVDAIAD